MKPVVIILLLFFSNSAAAQSLDYISVRKKNGQVIKNFYTGSAIVLQLTDGSYLQGPVQTIRNDSVYVMVYDIRLFATNWGTSVRDTIAATRVGIWHSDIGRIFLNRRRGFFERNTGPLLMIGGAGYLGLNLLNGAFYNQPTGNRKNLRKLGTAAGAFGLGYLLKKLFASDGFSKKSHQIVLVDL